MLSRRRFSRRVALRSTGFFGLAALLAACGQATPASPTSAPTTAQPSDATPTSASGAAAQSTAAATPKPTVAAAPTTAQSASSVQQVPRNQTLILSLSDALNQFSDVPLMNPFMPGIARNGWQFAFEPLYFYDMWWTGDTCGPKGLTCKDGEIPWLAESYTYSQDYSQVSITIRNGVTWSDGQPFTADDIAFTLNMLKDNAPKLTFSVEMKNWVKEAVAVDASHAKITLNNPNPRFFFDYFAWHSDFGIPIVPKHIWEGKDPTKFTNLDLNQGWPVVTGPWKLTFVNADQRFWDRREDWWAAKTGFHPLPKMQRIITLPNYTDDQQLTLLANNEVDATHGFQNAFTVPTAIQRNPKLIAWTTDNKPPYGALDVATITSLDFNCSKPPFDDPEIRWAINHAINRDQIIQVGSHGVGAPTALPFPPYGALKPFYDNVNDIFQKTPIDAFDVQKSAQIMQSKGYQKDQGGFWAKDGKRFSPIITTTPPFFTDITPVIVQQLRKAGFDVTWKQPSNANDLIAQGDVDMFLFVPAGSVRDPYVTLSFFISKYSAPTGQSAVYPYRWKNDQFDKVIDQLGKMSITDPTYMNVYHQAMEVWIPNLPYIPLIQRYIYILPNTTYWTNWPSEKYPYTLASGWHRTSGLFINTLQPAGG